MRCLLCAALLLCLSGCAVFNDGQEVVKTVWGSSTRALEQARDNAIYKVYDQGYWPVLRAAVNVAKKKEYVIFKKDEVRGYMVLMGIHGSVNTTEVGVFFVELNDHQTKIEISSLSTNAKRIVAKNLFHGLDIAFGLVPPDPVSDVSSVTDQGQKPAPVSP